MARADVTMQWKRVAAGKIARMSPSDALATIHRINKCGYGYTIEQPEIRALTGGVVSQNINFYVMRLLGKRAGILS
jgi:hypothetical protein